MLKHLRNILISLVLAAPIGAPAGHAAGTIPLAMAVQVDSAGNQMPGCLLSFFVAGTVATPQNSFSDFGLSLNPLATVTCDQSGRLPMFWLADGLIHVRLTTSDGIPVIDTTMQVLGPSSGGGGGGSTVDPTTILSTGDEKVRYGTGPLAGFVRENGLTIGNSTSGATERANPDTQPLWVYLYVTDPNLVVSGGRTGNALNDYNASKTITTPDMRGKANIALADMGNSATSLLTATYFGGNVTTLGSIGGLQNFTLTTPNLPPYTPSTSSLTASTSVSNGTLGLAGNSGGGFSSGGAFPAPTGIALATTVSAVFVAQGGTSTPFAVIPPAMLKTFYLKL